MLLPQRLFGALLPSVPQLLTVDDETDRTAKRRPG